MSRTHVIMLGTGTPNPVPDKHGPSVAIVVDDRSYIVDAGSGVVRQTEKAHQLGFPALNTKELKRLFITHLHSDHTVGYTDFILTPWVLERDEPLQVFGPPGIASMTEHILEAYSADIQARTHGLEQANRVGIQVEVTQIQEGVVYQDDLVTVTAFRVDHRPLEAFGYRFETPDKTIVISGDTAACDNLVTYAQGCDLLIHEVASARGVQLRTPKWHTYHTTVHTLSTELGEIAARVNPPALVLYHQLFMAGENEIEGAVTIAQREAEMIEDIRAHYDGEIYSAKDLDIF